MENRGTQWCAFGCNKRTKRKLDAEAVRSASEGSADKESERKQKFARTFHSSKALGSKNRAPTSSFLALKDRGLLKPTESVVVVCEETERRFERMMVTTKGKLPRIKGITGAISLSVLQDMNMSKVFNELNDHITCSNIYNISMEEEVEALSESPTMSESPTPILEDLARGVSPEVTPVEVLLEPQESVPKKKRREEPAFMGDLLKSLEDGNEILKNREIQDEDYHFGVSIGKRLQKFPIEERDDIKIEIMKSISMEEEVEVLSESPTMSESPTPSLEVLARGVPPEPSVWKEEVATIDADIKAEGVIINVGDGHADSPGHSANFESKSSIQQKGSAISVHQTCTGCDVTHQWRSQPDIADTPAGNLKLSSAILFSGSCVAKILNLMRHMGIPTITEQTIYMHQRCYLQPAVSSVWEEEMATIDADIKARGGIINVGDGNAASPGHSANFESKSSIQQKGSAISVHQTCTGCDVTHQWRSQPDIADTPAGNLKLSSAILFSGSCVAKILNLMRHMGIPTITEQTIYMHQRCYLQPAVSSVWEEEMATIDADIKARGGIINVGDGNAASPGHSANFGTYTLLETATKKVLQIELVSISWSFIILFQTFVGLLQMVSVGMMSLQVTEVSISNAMEKEELVRAMKAIQQRGLKVKEITTDRHTSIRKYLWEKHQDVKHSLDVWHVAKDKGASGSKSGKKTKATGKTGMSSESHESLLAVSTQQLKTLVTQAVTERFADLQLSRPPTPSPLPTQVVERMDQPIDPTPSLEELLARLQTVVDDKKLRTRDLEEARILLLWKSKTETWLLFRRHSLDRIEDSMPRRTRSLRKRNNVSYAPTAHSSSSSDISDISFVPSNFSGLSDISLSSMYDLAANATDNTCHHTSLLDSEYEPLPEDIADMVLDLKEDPIMDLNHIRLFLLRVQRPTRGRSGRNPPAWVTLSEDGNEDEQTGTADAPNRLIQIKGIPRTHQTTLPLMKMKMHPMTPEVMMKLFIKLVLSGFSKYNILLNNKKSVLFPVQNILYLGVWFNFHKATISLAKARRIQLYKLIDWVCHKRVVNTKVAQRIRGSLLYYVSALGWPIFPVAHWSLADMAHYYKSFICNKHIRYLSLHSDSATMFTDAIPGRIGWIDCKGSSKSLKKPLLIHLVEGLALIRALADHVNRYPTLKRILIHCDNTVVLYNLNRLNSPCFLNQVLIHLFYTLVRNGMEWNGFMVPSAPKMGYLGTHMFL
ncbi:hypothetical protein GQR58_016540 [Nymphon striatum]|nr:hypothetical protein GQR58_016540 [Nymphon striatum]